MSRPTWTRLCDEGPKLPPRPWKHVDAPVALIYAADRFPHVLDATGKPVAFVSWGDGDDPMALAQLLALAPELADLVYQYANEAENDAQTGNLVALASKRTKALALLARARGQR